MSYDKRMNDDVPAASIDQTALASAILQRGEEFYRSITERHAHLFAAVPVFITSEQLSQMQAVIAAVEAVVSLPGWS